MALEEPLGRHGQGGDTASGLVIYILLPIVRIAFSFIWYRRENYDSLVTDPLGNGSYINAKSIELKMKFVITLIDCITGLLTLLFNAVAALGAWT